MIKKASKILKELPKIDSKYFQSEPFKKSKTGISSLFQTS